MNKQLKTLIFGIIYSILLAIPLTACAFSADQAEQIIIEQLATVTPEEASEVQQAATATTMRFEKSTGITLKKPVTLVLTPDRQTYIAEVINRFHVTNLEAEKAARGTDALSGSNLIVINMSGIPTVRQKTFLIAHELTHQYQRQLAGNRASQIMWLLEGMAETVGAQVVAEQGYFRLDQYEDNWQRGLQHIPYKPTLRELETRNDWSQAIGKYNSTVIYKTAGLAVLILTTEFGEQKVLDYFIGLGQGLTPGIAFQNAFGITLTDYENRFTTAFPLAS